MEGCYHREMYISLSYHVLKEIEETREYISSAGLHVEDHTVDLRNVKK
jgi:hypothetical protein